MRDFLRRSVCSSLLAASGWLVGSGTLAQASNDAEHHQTGRALTLQTAATLAARPTACGAIDTRRTGDAPGRSRWAEVREVDLRRRCVRLARGLSQVTTQPDVVLRSFPAAATQPLSPAKAHDSLTLAEAALVARALARSGETAKAYVLFSALQKRSALAEWHVSAVHDYAVSASREGQFATALACYRRLVSLASWLPPETRVDALIEAAVVALRSTPHKAEEALDTLELLKPESVRPEARVVAAVVELSARALLFPETALPESPALPERIEWSNAPRVPAEDATFVDAFLRYRATGQWSSDQDAAEASGPAALSAPAAYVALLARLRVLQ